MKKTENLNIAALQPLISPKQLKAKFPVTAKANRTVVEGREAVQAILRGEDPRLLLIIGPCSIHEPTAAWEYAQKLKALSDKVQDKLVVLMRVYFEKPRTTVGWRGFISDPDLNDKCDISKGLQLARDLLIKINHLGLPAATELLDPVVPQYIADLITWAAIGARTTESQTHRQMASGLSMPVGFKNGTDGNVQVAVDAMQSARSSHSFLGLDAEGQTCIVKTKGNPYGHVVLRGGRVNPNYDVNSIAEATQQVSASGLESRLVVDCSHGNTQKKHELQEAVWDSIIEQRLAGNKSLMGLMVESHLFEGSQKIPADLSKLRYGVSVTDNCIGWELTEQMILRAHKALSSSKKKSSPTKLNKAKGKSKVN